MKEMLTGSDLTIEPEVEDLLVQIMSDCSDAIVRNFATKSLSSFEEAEI